MMNLLNFIMLQGAPKEGQEQKPMNMFIMIALIMVVFYFFMIRPQQKKQKEMRNFRDSLKKGDKIVTTGGIYGKIVSITDNVMTIDVGNSVTVKIDKNAVLKDISDLEQPQKK